MEGTNIAFPQGQMPETHGAPTAPLVTAYPQGQMAMTPIAQPVMISVAYPQGQQQISTVPPNISFPQGQMVATPVSQPAMTSIAYPQGQAAYAFPQYKAPTPVGGWGPYPRRLLCVHCKNDITTSVKFKPVLMTHAACLFLCFVGCWPCALIPYCTNSAKGAFHSCPSCRMELGRSNGDC